MIDKMPAPTRPTERLMQAWIHHDTWKAGEAISLALGTSPYGDAAAEPKELHRPLLERAGQDGLAVARPIDWLWWGEKNGLPYHADWWLGVTPEGPIGFDGRHFAFNREEMLSERYLRQERKLINKWARKPYWTTREAIDITLNFTPYRGGWRGEAPETGETIREREDRFRIFGRAMESGQISEKASPRDYFIWFDKCGYFVSVAWRRALDMSGGSGEQAELKALALDNVTLKRDLKEKSKQIEALEISARSEPRAEGQAQIGKLRAEIKRLKADPDNPSQKAAMTRRINSLQKALLAAAVDCYSYDPRRPKSDAAQQISEKSSELGCRVTAQTISKHLNESADAHVDQAVWDVIFPRK